MGSIRAAFVMEQTLGHVTHYRNLRDVSAEQSDVVPTWLPIPFEIAEPSRSVPLLSTNWSVRASWRARRRLAAAFARHTHDAVVFHTQVTAQFSLAIMRQIPAVVSMDATQLNYDTVSEYYGHRPAGNNLIDRLKFRLNRRVFQSAAGLVTWSEWARRSLANDYDIDPARVRAIAPGAAAAYFGVGARRCEATPPLDAPRARVRLLFVGGDFQRKGGPLLLECMCGPLGNQCELHLVTSEAVADQPNVYVYRGLEPNSPELLRLFTEADLFVLPSRAECLAVVLMEATAAALPVITTDVGALGEAVRPGESGLVLPSGDPRALHQAIATLAGDPGRRRRMGRAGYALAREKFDARANGLALLQLAAEVGLAGHRARRVA